MKKTADLKPHVRNANKGSLRGSIQLEESIKRFGAGRSIVVDKNGVVIAGNHALEAWGERPIELVQTTGDKLVVVQRTDLDLESATDKRAAGLAIADNRSSEVGLSWDGDAIAAEIANGLDLTPFFLKDELEEIFKKEADEDESDDKPKSDEARVKLQMTDAQYEEFVSSIKELMEKWGLTDTVEVLLLCLRKARKEGA